MPKKEERTIDKIAKSLYTDIDEIKNLTPKEFEIRNRLVKIFTIWHDKPSLTDSQMIQAIRNFKDDNGKHIEERQAYRDLHNVKILLGNVQNASKEWHRYTVIEVAKRAIQIAEAKKDPIAMIMGADKIGKYTKCDQREDDAAPWEDIIPPSLDTTNDIRVLDPKLYDKDIDEKRRKLRAKFSGDVIDTDYEDVSV